MKRQLGIVILASAALWMTRCATTSQSSKPAESAVQTTDVDQLLGLDSSGKGIDATETIAEDDVLKLLGVQDQASGGSKKEAPAAAPASPMVNSPSDQSQFPKTQQDQSTALASTETNPKTPVWTPPPAQSKSGSFAGQYQAALQLYKNRNYREAIQHFEALLSTDSRNSLSDNCQYWIGESYYGMGNYQQAVIAFEKVFTFSNSNKDDDAQLKVGMCYIKMNDKPKAKAELQKLIDVYPSSEYVSVARRLLANQ
jgi:tol-pal system protein YbgF